MKTLSMFQKGSVQRAKALSIPKRIYVPILRRVSIWHKSSGEEWTVDRLKAIKLDIIRGKAGMLPVSSWIKRNRFFLSGEFGSLEKWMLLSDKNFARGLQLLQIYTTFRAKVITPKQREKFLSGVQCAPPQPAIIEFANSVIDRGFERLTSKHLIRKFDSYQPLADMIPSPSKRAPVMDSTCPETSGIVDSIRYLFETTEGHTHYLKYKSHYRRVLDGLWDVLVDPNNRSDNRDVFEPLRPHGSFLVGRIGLIQEPGYKLRAVANPGRVFQRVLEPLGGAIYDLLKILPFDCTFDQTKAVPVLQEHLSHSKTVHSIDLSGATDYFPLSLQRHLLYKMYPQSDVDLFCDLSQASWFMPHVGEIKWERGQPLGLYPSFGAFALTHGILLLGLLNKDWNNQFFVLGDDVVILDDQLAQDYFQMLSILGCPVSIPKSLTSNSLCEFGGKVLTPSTVISQYKWRDISDDSFMDIAKIVGPRSLVLFKPRQIRIIKRFSQIPDFLGGLGWNPKGLSLEIRSNDPLIWQEKQPVDHLMDYSVVRIRNLFNSKLYQRSVFHRPYGYNTVMIDRDRDLDQRSSLLVKSLLGIRFANFEKNTLGKNVDSVSLQKFGVHANLPINTLDGSTLRPSLLKVMEAKVRRLEG